MNAARSAPSPAAGSRLAGETLLVGVLAWAFYGWLSVRPDFTGSLADAAIYLALSDYFSPYRADPYQLGPALLRDYAYPPLYPLVLAWLGGGGSHPIASHIAQAGLMAVAVAAVYAWLRLRVPGASAAIIGFVFAVLPATLLCALDMQSEPLYIALVFGGLALAAQAHAGRRSTGVLLLGLSALARSVGVAAVAAAVVHWLLHSQRRRLWFLPLLAIAPYAAWLLVRESAGLSASYFDAMNLSSVQTTLASVAGQSVVNAQAGWNAMVRSFDFDAASHVRLIVAAFLLLAFAGWCARVRHLEHDSLYLLCYLATVLIWPYPNHLRRFLHVVFPLFAFYAHGGLALLLRGCTTPIKSMGLAAGGALLVMAMAPTTLDMLREIGGARGAQASIVRAPHWHVFDRQLVPAEVMQRVDDITAGMRGIDRHVPGGACVASALHPYIALYGHRLGRALPGVRASDSELSAALRSCPYVFMVAATQWPPTDYPPMYPYARISDRLEVLEVTLWDRRQPRGAVLTMLAKVKPRGDGGTVGASD